MQEAWKESEVLKIVEFIGEKLKCTNSPENLKQYFEQYRNETRTLRTTDEMRKKLHDCITKDQSYLRNFDAETKLKLLYTLKIPIGTSFLRELQRNADVELNEYFRISSYKSHTKGGLTIGKPNREKLPSEEPLEKMLNFVASFSKEHSSPVTNDTLAYEYMEFVGVRFELRSLSERFRTVVKPAIQTAKQFDVQTRLRMLYITKTPVGDSFLARVRDQVKLGDKGQIISYKSVQESLEELRMEIDKKAAAKRVHESNIDEPSTSSSCRKRAQSARTSSTRSSTSAYYDDMEKKMKIDEKKAKNGSSRETSKCFARRTGNVVYISSESDTQSEAGSTKSARKPQEKGKCYARRTGKVVKPSAEGGSKHNDRESLLTDDSGFDTFTVPNDSETVCKEEPIDLTLPVKQEEPDYTSVGSLMSVPPSVIDGISTPRTVNTPIPNNNLEANLAIFFSEYQSTSSENGDNTNVKDFLKLLRGLVRTMESPLLAQIEGQIKNSIDWIGDDHVPIDNVILALKTFFRLVTRKASRIEDESMSLHLPTLLILLNNVVNGLESPKIEELKTMIRDETALLDAADDKVPAKYIELALETTIGLVTPRFFNP